MKPIIIEACEDYVRSDQISAVVVTYDDDSALLEVYLIGRDGPICSQEFDKRSDAEKERLKIVQAWHNSLG